MKTEEWTIPRRMVEIRFGRQSQVACWTEKFAFLKIE